MISGQVCQAGRLHPTVQSKQVHLPPSHWTKWASPGIPKTTGGCLIAISLVALFFPVALANPLNPPYKSPSSLSTDMKLPDQCSKTNSIMSQNDLDEFIHCYPHKNLVEIKSVKTQKTLYVDPTSKKVFFDTAPKNYSEYFQISRHPSKSGHLVKNVFSCLYLCVTRQGNVYTVSNKCLKTTCLVQPIKSEEKPVYISNWAAFIVRATKQFPISSQLKLR